MDNRNISLIFVLCAYFTLTAIDTIWFYCNNSTGKLVWWWASPMVSTCNYCMIIYNGNYPNHFKKGSQSNIFTQISHNYCFFSEISQTVDNDYSYLSQVLFVPYSQLSKAKSDVIETWVILLFKLNICVLSKTAINGLYLVLYTFK